MIYFNKLIDICINRQESPKVVNIYGVGTIRTSRVSKDNLEVLIIKIVQSSNKSSNTFPKLEFL